MNKLKTLVLFVFAAVIGNANATDNLPAVVSSTDNVPATTSSSDAAPAAQNNDVPAATASTENTPAVIPSSEPAVAENGPITYTLDNLPIDPDEFVCNPDSILSQATISSLNNILHDLEEEAKYQALIVAVNKISYTDVKLFAENIGNKYGVGDKDINNGLVIVFVKDMREMYIATGSGTQEKLSNERCQQIIDQYFIPSFKNNNWDAGMVSGTKAIYRELTNTSTTGGSGSGKYFLLGFLGVFGLIIYRALTKKEKCPNCGKDMVYKREKNTDENGAEQTRALWECPACGHIIELETKDVAENTPKKKPRTRSFNGGKFDSNSGAGGKF